MSFVYPKDKVTLLASQDAQLSELEYSLEVARKDLADAQAALLLANKDRHVCQ